jgi:hypothetical protein
VIDISYFFNSLRFVQIDREGALKRPLKVNHLALVPHPAAGSRLGLPHSLHTPGGDDLVNPALELGGVDELIQQCLPGNTAG